MNSFSWARARSGMISSALVLGFVLIQSPLWKPVVNAQTAQAGTVAQGAQSAPMQQAVLPVKQMSLTVGKSTILDIPASMQRVSVANPDLVETVAIDPRQLLINGKTEGETSMIVWQQDGSRLEWDLSVHPSTARLDAVRREIAKELEGQVVNVSFENNTVFLRGTVKNLTSADRAVSIASTLGKTVNLLHVEVPQGDQQILLKVRFADVDRNATQDLGWNLFSTGATNSIGTISTNQYNPPQVSPGGSLSLTDALNLFIYRHDLNLGATIRALEAKALLQILAEPNVLAMDGKTASFLAGGQFPVPVVTGGALSAVSITYRQFGVSLDFLPHITARGTIKLQVTPEVSSLDYANGVVISGFNVPGLNTRKLQTEIELENGQSFVIGGLLDNRMSETLSRIPGLASVPVLGKLFMSRSRTRNHSELLVLVTAEIVRPIPKDQTPPDLYRPYEFMTGKGILDNPPRTPGMDVTGPVPVTPAIQSLPIEELLEMNKREKNETPTPPQLQLVPVPMNTAPAGSPPQQTPASTMRTTSSGAGGTD